MPFRPLRACFSAADQPAPSTAAAAAASTAAATPSSGSPPSGHKAKSISAGGGDFSEELWVVGRFMEDMDKRLGAKQEKIREFFDCSGFCVKYVAD